MSRLDRIALIHSRDAYDAAMTAWWVEHLPMSWIPEDRP